MNFNISCSPPGYEGFSSTTAKFTGATYSSSSTTTFLSVMIFVEVFVLSSASVLKLISLTSLLSSTTINCSITASGSGSGSGSSISGGNSSCCVISISSSVTSSNATFPRTDVDNSLLPLSNTAIVSPNTITRDTARNKILYFSKLTLSYFLICITIFFKLISSYRYKKNKNP